MSNATDNLFEAEKMIRSTITETVGQKRAIDICNWLLSINNIAKDHLIKCYRANDKSIRYCIDRGHDCEGTKITTIFLAIKSNFQIHIQPPNDIKSYLKEDWKAIWYYIPGPVSRTLSMEDIQKHILESYSTKLEKLGMSVPKFIPGDHQQKNIAPPKIFYLPTKSDVDCADSQLRTQSQKSDDEPIGKEDVLDQIETNCNKTEKVLQPNWREITRRNIEIWFNKEGK